MEISTPILNVDICLGEGNQTRIVVCKNDKAEDLARAFCQEHKLDP